MDFSSVIDKITKDVQIGLDEPFLVYRDKIAGWQCDYAINQYNQPYEWIDAVKERDPYALIYTGKSFSDGSFSKVYDAVLSDRLRAEFEHNKASGMYNQASIESWFNGMEESEAAAFINFFEENVASLSHNAKDYFSSIEKPFAALCEICPYNIAMNCEGQPYNKDFAERAIECIEDRISENMRNQDKNVVMTPGDCIKGSRNSDYTGKPLVVKADALMPEYRNSFSQLVFCTHGNGAKPHGKGTSIFCKELASNKTVVYYRYEIEGVADTKKMPFWARLKLSEFENERKEKGKPALNAKPSIMSSLAKSKAVVAATDNAERSDKPKLNKHTERK